MFVGVGVRLEFVLGRRRQRAIKVSAAAVFAAFRFVLVLPSRSPPPDEGVDVVGPWRAIHPSYHLTPLTNIVETKMVFFSIQKKKIWLCFSKCLLV